MEPDMNDLVQAWLGHEIDPARYEQLLARLHADAAFRREFVAEIRIHGMLKTVQSPEPRWLRLEDELGWSAVEPGLNGTLEDRVAGKLGDSPRPHRAGRRRWWAAAAAAVLVAAASVTAFWPKQGSPLPVAEVEQYPRVDTETGLAMVIKLDAVTWELAGEPHPSEGDVLGAGRLRLKSGRATISLLSGVMMVVEGPADVELVSVDRIYCRRGKVRSRVPKGAEGFVVSAPGSAVIDMGTEFAVNLTADGRTRGRVFEGEVEASVLSRLGTPERSMVLRESKDFEINPGTGEIDTLDGSERFIEASELAVAPLALSPAYPRAVLDAHPWGYWRFQSMVGGRVANEVVDGPPLQAVGPVRLAGTAGGNPSVEFINDSADQYLTLGGPWEPVDQTGYAVELWFASTSISHAALASLVVPADSNHHSLLLELTSRNRLTLFKPASVRFLHRLPPSRSGGDTTFSDPYYIPFHWHHLVGQVSGGLMQVFIDGEASPAVRISTGEVPRLGQFLLGRLTTSHEQDPGWNRSFRGQMDEVALYAHPLTHDEIRLHYRLAVPGARGPGR
jgi:Concanavalin A-like lectin/glucanases superfamily